MSEVTHKRIDDLDVVAEFVEGFEFRRARAALGVSSFGLSIIDMPPGTTSYPEHDHAVAGGGPPPELGQEEVYVALRGSGEMEVDGQRYPLDSEHIIRVGASAKRKPLPGPEGMRLLVIGGIPGEAYDPGPTG
jgi:mannose-6-phosphate isomerase-like protein (cupin superfamily)